LKVAFKSSFAKDLHKLKDQSLKNKIKTIIEATEQANTLSDVTGIKKLKGESGYYRVRVGNYRLGLFLEEDTIYFVRFLHRKDIYRYFP